jgi:hypothetical protein
MAYSDGFVVAWQLPISPTVLGMWYRGWVEA